MALHAPRPQLPGQRPGMTLICGPDSCCGTGQPLKFLWSCCRPERHTCDCVCIELGVKICHGDHFHRCKVSSNCIGHCIQGAYRKTKDLLCPPPQQSMR